MQLSSFARKAMATGLTASTILWSAMAVAPQLASAVVHSDGCIVISNGTAWYITGGTRRGFPSAEVFQSYGYNFSQLAQASAEDVALPVGPIMVYADGTLVKGPGDPLIYLVTSGQKRGFTSGAVFSGLGFSFTNVQSAPFNTFADLVTGANIDTTNIAHPAGVTVLNNGTIWLMSSTGRMGYPSMAVFQSRGMTTAKVVSANAMDMALPEQAVVTLLTGCSGGISPTPTPTPSSGPFNPNGGTQGSIENVTAGSRNDTEALEGQGSVEIAAWDVELSNDGNLQLQSADVWFANSNTPDSSLKPWDYFNSVALLVGGSVVSTINTNSSGAWSDASDGNISGGTTTDEYRLRFTGLSSTLSSNATTKVSVAVTMVSNIDSDDEDAVWNTELTGVRVLDESHLVLNANQTDFTATSTELESSFSVGERDVADIDIRDAASPVDATLFEVSETADTNAVAIYNFTIKEKNGVAVTFDDLQMTFTTADPTSSGAKGDLPNNVVKNARLWEGASQRGNTESVPSSGIVLFDNTNISLGANQTKTFTVKVDLFDNNEGNRYGEGTTISVDIDAANLTATDANGNDEQDMTKSVSAGSETHELRSQGIRVALVGTPTSALTATDLAGGDLVTFQWKLDITGFGDNDVYINKDIADITQTGTASDVDTIFTIENSSTPDPTGEGGTLVVTSSSTPSDVTGIATTYQGAYNGEEFFVIPTGSTRSFTLTVNTTNGTTAQQIRALLENIEWTSDDITSTTANVLPATINDYIFNLGSKAAAPFITAN